MSGNLEKIKINKKSKVGRKYEGVEGRRQEELIVSSIEMIKNSMRMSLLYSLG